MAEDDTTTSVDMTQDDDTQDARTEPTESETSLDVDLVDDETKEKREKFTPDEGEERTTDDIENPELREAVEAAEQAANDSDEEDEPGNQRVQVSEGEDPMDAIEQAGTDDTDDTDASEGSGVMEGVDDDDVADAMDMELNVREDIDPEHFNYEEQDFSVFGGYGQSVTIEYNETLFHLVQPGDREQEELINNMGGGLEGDGMEMAEMMGAMIDATVARPQNIAEITEGWTPFERMGLGLQCMEFLGIDALGNM